MKKVLTYISLFVFGAALFSSCNLNESPKFNDKDAFVAFDKAAVSVKEEGKTVVIPVTLASLKGVSTSVSYEALDGTAKNGVDYKLADETGILTFTPEARTQYITVNIIERDGVYTGDLKFSLKFKSTGDVAEGAENSCTITIQDHDHPLAAILGEYNASGVSGFNGPVQWTMELRKDAEDASVVWFFNIANMGGNAIEKTMFYGVVNEDKTEITINVPQECAAISSSTGKPAMTLVATFIEGNSLYFTSSNVALKVAIKENGKVLDFGSEYGFGPAADVSAGSFYEILVPGVKAIKK